MDQQGWFEGAEKRILQGLVKSLLICGSGGAHLHAGSGTTHSPLAQPAGYLASHLPHSHS